MTHSDGGEGIRTRGLVEGAFEGKVAGAKRDRPAARQKDLFHALGVYGAGGGVASGLAGLYGEAGSL